MSEHTITGAFGDGVHDDTAAIQAALDSEAGTVHLPKPPRHYLISKTLKIHSGQTLAVDRHAVIRLADHAHAHMLTNADHAGGNAGVTVTGGIWDGNNEHQTCEYHQSHNGRVVPYDPARYLGVLLQFNNVTDLRVAHVTLKDPEMFGLQAGNLSRFTIEDITFDYNLLRLNMDGVHLNGNCRQGRIANLKGTTNDDMVALNADDGSMAEISRGPITDIQVDGLWARNGYTGVRLLSAGSPVKRVRISNIHGFFRYHVVYFSHHFVHPGEPTTFADIVIDGVFCEEHAVHAPHPPMGRLFYFQQSSVSDNIHIQNLFHRETLENKAPWIHVEPGAQVGHLSLRHVHMSNESPAPVDLLMNEGDVASLHMADILATSGDTVPRGRAVVNRGRIGRQHMAEIHGLDLPTEGTTEDDTKKVEVTGGCES